MQVDDLDTKLNRCLSAIDLSFIGLSTMVSGIFIVTGTVVHDMAGPGIIFSYVVAGIAAILSAFSYAEMGSRVPRAGSSYVYASVALGEIWGFLTGWNMILEYVLISATMSRSFTSTFVLVLGGQNISEKLDEASIVIVGQRTDIIAVGVVIIFVIIVGFGVRLTSGINIAFNLIAISMVVGVSIFCFAYGDIDNWVQDGPRTFFPHGIGGVVSGGAICYFSYIGFEAITVSGEECLTPKTSVPLGILLCFVMALFSYVITSLGLTYFAPASEFVPNKPLADMFFTHGYFANGMVVGISGLLSISTNILVTIYAVPRVFYAMACDGLIFSWLGKVSEKTQTPIPAMVVGGFLIAILTFFLDVSTLVEAVSIGTLISYILVAIGVLILRFEANKETQLSKFPLETINDKPTLNSTADDKSTKTNEDIKTEKTPLAAGGGSNSYPDSMKLIPGDRKAWVEDYWFFREVWPDVKPTMAIMLMTFFMFLFALSQTIAMKTHQFGATWNKVLAPFLTLPIIFWMVHLVLYEQNKPPEGTYRVK